jgi:DNA modification methylase
MNASRLRIEYLPLAELRPYERNARTHSADQVAQIAASMRAFGWTNPLLVDERGTIIAGHGRLMAAAELGLTEAPAIRLVGLSEQQQRALTLADNKLALNAGWNAELLAAELQGLGDLQGVAGFSADELMRLLGGRAGLTDPDEVPPTPAEPVTRPGDLWLLGPHRLVCGDATFAGDVALALAGTAPHLMVTDPPYGVDYDPMWRAEAGVNNNRGKMGIVANDDRADWRAAWSLFPGDVAYVWHADRHAAEVQASLEAAGLAIVSQIIWAKDRLVLSRGDYHWQHEPCWYAVRGGKVHHWVGERDKTTLWRIAVANGKPYRRPNRQETTLWEIDAREDGGHGHGTQKPVECMRRPIENNSNVGQAVYDPFVGSGTTIIAAETMGRVCHAIEIDPIYCDVAVTRWENFTGLKAERRPAHANADAA